MGSALRGQKARRALEEQGKMSTSKAKALAKVQAKSTAAERAAVKIQALRRGQTARRALEEQGKMPTSKATAHTHPKVKKKSGRPTSLDSATKNRVKHAHKSDPKSR